MMYKGRNLSSGSDFYAAAMDLMAKGGETNRMDANMELSNPCILCVPWLKMRGGFAAAEWRSWKLHLLGVSRLAWDAGRI